MPRTERLGVPYHNLPVIDVHTHTSGSDADGPASAVVRCMDACGVEQAFMFAPLLEVHGLQLTDEHLDDIRRHNDYISHYCAASPERLLAFAVLNPNPGIAHGDLDAAVDLMVQEARRCYHELGIRGVKMVPDRWSVDDEQVAPLLRELAGLGMYVAFHCGIFLDERSSTYCRPALYEGAHLIPGFRGHLSHLGWPWVDECIATLAMETFHPGPASRDRWQLKADLSFGCPPDWQLQSVARALNMLPMEMLMYASDCFWPSTPTRYLEEFIYPQLANLDAAATLSRTAPPAGGEERARFRRRVFYDNALEHWEAAIRGNPQQLRRQRRMPRTPHARARRDEHQQAMRSPAINQPRQAI